MLSTGDVPTRFEGKTLDEYVPTTPSARKAIVEARRLLAGEITGLVLIGKTGVGKTHVAAGIVEQVLAQEYDRRADHEEKLATWTAEYQTFRAAPPWAPNDPEQVAAAAAWQVKADARAAATAEWEQLRGDHWRRQPPHPRPSDEWEAWDAEIPGLEARRRELVPVMTDPGPKPFVGPTTADREAHEAEYVAWTSDRQALAARRPRWHQRPEPAWVNVADMILNLRMEMGQPFDDREETAKAHRLRHHPALVVLDDLGREKASDWTGEVVYGIANARYEALLPTIVTSNLTAAELAASPYWPVISRLAEGGALIEVTGSDHRLARP